MAQEGDRTVDPLDVLRAARPGWHYESHPKVGVPLVAYHRGHLVAFGDMQTVSQPMPRRQRKAPSGPVARRSRDEPTWEPYIQENVLARLELARQRMLGKYRAEARDGWPPVQLWSIWWCSNGLWGSNVDYLASAGTLRVDYFKQLSNKHYVAEGVSDGEVQPEEAAADIFSAQEPSP